MTWASRSLSRSFSRSLSHTSLFLKKQLWVWPIIAVVLLATIGFGMKRAIESTMKESLRSELLTLLNVEVAMLENWFRVQESQAETLANGRHLRESVYQLLAGSPTDSPATPSVGIDPIQQEIRKDLAPAMNSYNYVGYFIADRQQRIVASSSPELLGQSQLPEYDSFLSRALEGQTVVSVPFASVVAMKDSRGHLQTGVPTMFACAPIRDENFQVVAVLALRIRPELEFTRILSLGSRGVTGETYAFDKRGVLVSNSRFDNDLVLLGLLPDQEGIRSILNLSLKDPQGDMTKGFRPTVRRSELPLTKMASEAIAGRNGHDLEGYRDYRGTLVIGTWTWLPNYEIGIATEIDAAEAFQPLTILRMTFFGMFGLLIASSIAIFIITLLVAQAERKARESALEARQLGQYRLEEKLGSGAMGIVYRGFHAMMRRPTAVKLLDVDKVDDESIQRFEREVQITCQLNHPNTVAIYDYGRTPEGVFYYAMEYLDGITLQSLVERYGPQPEGRVISILEQICGSLYEAHSLGLVHRDIKPANIMLNRRGGEADVVKVLDFGLVKAIDEHKQAGLTGQNTMTGTPLYMSPEAIQSPNLVDARSDIYAVGAVGYFLLTGRPVFEADSLVLLCQRHVSEVPTTPSMRSGQPISAELENALMSCLEKNRARRPQTARDLSQMIARSPAASSWTLDHAEAWWGRHERGQSTDLRSSAQHSTSSKRPVHDRTILSDVDLGLDES